MRPRAHRPGDHRRDHDSAAARGLRDRPPHHHGPRREEMKPVLLLCLLLLAPTARAQEIGRLFFTPEQRASLDARRKARVPDKPAAAAVAASPTLRLDGYVKRSDGRSTVWVNGESLGEGVQADSPRIDSRDSR